MKWDKKFSTKMTRFPKKISNITHLKEKYQSNSFLPRRMKKHLATSNFLERIKGLKIRIQNENDFLNID